MSKKENIDTAKIKEPINNNDSLNTDEPITVDELDDAKLKIDAMLAKVTQIDELHAKVYASSKQAVDQFTAAETASQNWNAEIETRLVKIKGEIDTQLADFNEKQKAAVAEYKLNLTKSYDDSKIELENKVTSFSAAVDSNLEQINDAHTKIVLGDKNSKSYIHDVETKVRSIENYKDSLFGDENGHNNGEDSIKNTIDKTRNLLTEIHSETSGRFKELTDLSIIDSFDKLAESANKKRLGLGIVFLVISLGISYVGYDLVKSEVDWLSLLLRLPIIIPLGLILFVVNRELKVEKVIEEQYKYKASLSKALKGYRNLYQLDHEDTEYMELFNVLKKEMLRSPFESIRPYLNQNLPWEKNIKVDKNGIQITDATSNTLNEKKDMSSKTNIAPEVKQKEETIPQQEVEKNNPTPKAEG